MIQEYIDSVGGRKYAAKRLGVSVSLITLIVQGKRSISKKLAIAIEEDSGGRFKKEEIIFS